MSELDGLLAQIEDEGLRSQLKAGVDNLARQLQFGLVFERHLPESIRAYSAPFAVGDVVQVRADIAGGDDYVVQRVSARQVTMTSFTTGEERRAAPREVVTVKRFGEAAYPALKPLGAVRQSDDRPAHAVINGENYHTLQLLRYLYRGKVDCIYIDPPYNTGATDWKYNNRYVEATDRWRHSKWLSFMEKRLILARDLLKPDGVLIVTIDEHEVHHLGVLLEQLFPGYVHHTVSIVINPKGTGKLNFGRVDEYALFCIPNNGENVIRGLPVEEANALAGLRTQEHLEQGDDEPDDEEDLATAEALEDTLEEGDDGAAGALAQEETEPALDPGSLPFPAEDLPLWELRHARRRGGESSYRHQRRNQFYPLYVDPEAGTVVRAGESLPLDEPPDMRPTADGLVPVWPIDKDGNERCWRYIPESMQQRIDGGFVVLGQPSADGTSWTINYWTPKNLRKRYKTVWWSKQHDAGTHGTTLLSKFLGRRNAFPFPKSLYAVRDTLLSVVRDRPDALILDFFAGSGTTLHATALINEADGGRRRSILVTNNEVDAKAARRLVREGHLPGEWEYEKHGIFWQATRPRVKAALTGRTPAGALVPGAYPGGRRYSAGFQENVEFFELVYLEKDDIRDGSQFAAIEPALWLSAGGVGVRPESDATQRFVIPEGSNYGVLFNRSSFAPFRRALAARGDVTHAFLVTNSLESYTQMTSQLPPDVRTSMLYRDYLANFPINTVEAFR